MSSAPHLEAFGTRLRRFMRRALRDLESPVIQDSASELEFSSLALELFGLQFACNPAYRRFCERLGVHPKSITDWRRIPAVPTLAFKELEFSSIPEQSRSAVFHSSGTTGQQPSRHFHCAESLRLYEASLWPWFAWHLLDPPSASSFFFASSSPREIDYDGETDDKPLHIAPSPALEQDEVVPQLLILTPSPDQAPHSSLVHMCETIRQHCGSPASVFFARADEADRWVLNMERLFQALEQAVPAHTPVMILGTAFLFLDLLEALADQARRIELPAGSRLMETGGYKGRSRQLPKVELHGRLTDLLGIPKARIICEYGMSELSSQAYDTIAVSERASASGRFHFPPWARAQIVSPETGLEVRAGETGLVRVFDLANAYSVMAVQTEDLGARHSNGFELIGRLTQAEPRGCSLLAV